VTSASGAGQAGRWPVPERSLIATVLGIPPLAAIALAAGLTTLGVLVDLQRIGTLGLVFTVCYFSGCVLAVAWVRRRSLFGPMVQPPLILAIAVPAVVLAGSSPRAGTGIAERLLVIGAPLINGFPTMAVTTGAVLVVGIARIAVQRPEATTVRADRERSRSSVSARRGSGAAREATRTSASPRRS